MLKKLFMLVSCALFVGGCTPALQFSEISPKIAEFHPKSVAIMPFTNSIGMESANNLTNQKLIDAINKDQLFSQIVDPSQVRAKMMSSQSLVDVVTRYRTTWVATGMCDPKLSAWLCKALGADSLVFGEVTAWSEDTTPYHHFYNAGIALRWVDASGEILWKCSEVWQIIAGNPCIFDCSHPENAMDQAVRLVVSNWPGKATSK
jgi:hypothetical protein